MEFEDDDSEENSEKNVQISTGLRKPVAEACPEQRLLREIVAAGIPSTFASDAHAPAEVGWGFERTLELAREAGAREYVTSAKRRQAAHLLPEEGLAELGEDVPIPTEG